MTTRVTLIHACIYLVIIVLFALMSAMTKQRDMEYRWELSRLTADKARLMSILRHKEQLIVNCGFYPEDRVILGYDGCGNEIRSK